MNIIKILWALITAIMLLLSIYFTFKLDFVQFKFSKYFKSFSKSSDSAGISPFKTLMLTLAGRIGVGSVAGMALAIYLGGAGSIFWMWIISILSLPIAYLETYYGSFYKEKVKNEYVGGPSFYILKGLGKIKLSKLYAFLIFLSFIIGFLGIQVNTIAKSINLVFSSSKVLIGLIIAFLTLIVVIGDVFSISKATAKIVPFMLFFYLIISTYILLINNDKIFDIIKLILTDAFNIKPFFSSFLYTLIIGVQRGIFSSEVGLGTGSITASASNSKSPESDGYLQMIGVSVTTLVICTIKSFLILLSPYKSIYINDANGIEIAFLAFSYHFKNLGGIFLLLFIFLCSFSTILTGYYDSLVSLKFMNIGKSYQQKVFLIIITIIMIVISSIISSSLMWYLVDLSTAILMLVNLYSLYCLEKKDK